MRSHLHWICWGALTHLACSADGTPQRPPPPVQGNAGSSGTAGGSGPILGGGPIIVGPGPGPSGGPGPTVDLGAECDPTREVAADSEALLVRDPAVLARFTLERVLARIIETANVESTPLAALQRLFDTENNAAAAVFPGNVHCDDALNPAFANGPAADCPRAEAALALSSGLLSDADPDGFVPIALVNRFDQVIPEVTCGIYHIVFAKRSGKTDASDRVLLSFQGWLPNPGNTLASCRPVVELWARVGGEPDVERRADALEQLFFEGLPGFLPVVDAVHYGLGDDGFSPPALSGQVQVAHGMQEPFQFRQFRLGVSGASGTPELVFIPTRLQLVPRPQLFDPALPEEQGPTFRSQLPSGVNLLATTSLPHMTFWSNSLFEAGESSVAGPAAPSYLARVRESTMVSTLPAELEALVSPPIAADCPTDDPLDGDALLQRLTALTCAGCHAPEQTIVPERGIGCGQAWPKSLGVSHVNEQGEVSEALSQVFLPHRAALLSLYLKGCDGAQVYAAFGLSPPQPEGPRPECFPAGTPITLADGRTRPIEQVEPGDWVMSFDRAAGALSSRQVLRRVVRPHAERFVVIEGTLVATDNHPFFADGRWVRAANLELGASLLRLREGQMPELGSAIQTSELRALELRAGSGETYNLDLEGHDGYFAGGYLVSDDP